MANVGIIYSDVSSHLRRIIVPDDDSILNDPALVLPGESMLVVSADELAAAKSIDDLVLQKGIVLTDPRCAVVDAGTLKVSSIINADPIIDVIPGVILVLSPNAGVGDTYNPLTKVFVKAIQL